MKCISMNQTISVLEVNLKFLFGYRIIGAQPHKHLAETGLQKEHFINLQSIALCNINYFRPLMKNNQGETVEVS